MESGVHMADDSLQSARLDHVRETGELVFEAGGEQFLVTVDDSLERAILEAKQIRQETMRFNQPSTANTLPISQIQQLIRAGADPAQVAEHYSLNEALVRRFSAAVQTEKQYAIEQFKHVPAPKESRAHSLEELIDRTLQTAGVDRDTLTWGATRQAHEPWHIIARFVSAGHNVHAEWSWNMHDNTVTCLNAAAKKLLGEHDAAASAHKAQRDNTHTNGAATGNAANTANTVTDVDTADTANAATQPLTARPEDLPSIQHPEPTLPAARSEPVATPAQSDNTKASQTKLIQPVLDGTAVGSNEGSHPASSAQAAQTAKAMQAPQAAQASQTTSNKSAQNQATQPIALTHHETKTQQPAKRRSGRSAVPSWDEILFGD